MQPHYAPQVKEQYEDFPYPPCDPADERKRLLVTDGDSLDFVNYYCYGGRESFSNRFRVLVAGCGTGHAVIYLAEQLRDTDAEIVALDFSEASLAIARKRSELRGLSNVKFLRAPVQDIPSLSLGKFDYIDCSGVLHHLADPDEGLRILAGVLEETGAMHIMVYGTYGRAAIYQMQDLLKRVAGPELVAAERVRRARALIAQLPESNAFKREFQRLGYDIVQFGDAGLYDLLLHAQDRSYTVPQIYAWLEQAGLRLATFDPTVNESKRIYYPASYLSDSALLQAIESKPVPEQQAIAELVAGNLSKHGFYVTKRAIVPPSPGEPETIPYMPAVWAGEDDICLMLHQNIARNPERVVTMGFQNSIGRISFKPTPRASLIFGHMDG